MIDDLIRLLNDKTDTKQTDFLKADIMYNIDKLLRQVDYAMEIAGPEHKFEDRREIHRDENCLSCSLPAKDFLNMPELEPLPPIKTASNTVVFKKGDADKTQPKDNGIVCYPNKPIRHPIDPRYIFD